MLNRLGIKSTINNIDAFKKYAQTCFSMITVTNDRFKFRFCWLAFFYYNLNQCLLFQYRNHAKMKADVFTSFFQKRKNSNSVRLTKSRTVNTIRQNNSKKQMHFPLEFE